MFGRQERRLGKFSFMSRLLVVGGTGFIGKNFSELAFNKGLKVTILSKSGIMNELNSSNLEVIKVNLLDLIELKKVLKGRSFEYIVNLSGYIDHSPYFSGGSNVLKDHLFGLLNLLNSIDRTILKSFIQIGSSDEYGGLPAPQEETMRESPISPYSSAKVASTHFLQSLNKTEGFPVSILRLFLVYGVGQKSDRFIPQVIEGCLNDSSFKTSEGKQLRDFTYVDDISKGILGALESKEILGEVVNLASGQGIPISTLISLIQEKVGQGKPEFGAIPYRPSENMELFADTTKAKGLLNWNPEIDLSKGIDLVIKDYQKK